MIFSKSSFSFFLTEFFQNLQYWCICFLLLDGNKITIWASIHQYLKLFWHFGIVLSLKTSVSCIPSWNFYLIGEYCRLALQNATHSKTRLEELSYGLPIGNFVQVSNVTPTSLPARTERKLHLWSKFIPTLGENTIALVTSELTAASRVVA